MTAESVGEVPGGLRAIDRQLLGLAADPAEPGVLWFDLVPHLCRTDGRFYGGAALAVALAAGEAVTGRPALWSSTQLVATATQGERVRVDTLADLVPLAICRACGVDGAGTSLDNSLRVGEPGDSDWVLLELDGHSAVGGYGHGHVHCWSQDGRLLATGTQSARLATAAEMLARRARAR
jgi:hypothetical protein